MAYAKPLKTKTSLEVATALDKIIAEFPVTPRRFMVDAGTEFSGASNSIYNIIVRKYKVHSKNQKFFKKCYCSDGYLCFDRFS